MYYSLYQIPNILYTLNVCWDDKPFPQIEFTLPTLLIVLLQNKNHHPKILACKYLYHYSLTHFYLRYTTTSMNFADVQPFLTCSKKGNHPPYFIFFPLYHIPYLQKTLITHFWSMSVVSMCFRRLTIYQRLVSNQCYNSKFN